MKTLYIPDFDDMYTLAMYLKKHGKIPIRTEETKREGKSYIQYNYDEVTKTIKLLSDNVDSEEDREITLMEYGKLVTEPRELSCVLESTLWNVRNKLPLLNEWYRLAKERDKERKKKGTKYTVVLHCFNDEHIVPQEMEVVAFDEEDAMKIAKTESSLDCYPVNVLKR